MSPSKLHPATRSFIFMAFLALSLLLTAELSAQGSVDLVVTKSVNDTSPNEGQTVTFTITVKNNNGPDDATNVAVTDVLPATLTFVSATVNAGSYSSSTGIWTVGALAKGVTRTLTLQASVNAGTAAQSIVNTASGTMDQTERTPGNESASVTLTVIGADVQITKTVNNAAPNEGGTVIFTVTARNNGPNTANTIQVMDLLPSGLTFVSSSQGAYTPATGIWVVGNLASGASKVMTLTATVNAGTAGQTITNTASVHSVVEGDPVPGNNSASAVLTVQAADLRLIKTVDKSTPYEGDTVIYTVTVTNLGPNNATTVAVRDTLPAGLTFVSSSATLGTFSNTTKVWTVGALNNTASATLTLTATVNSGTAGRQIVNYARRGGADQGDPNAANNVGTATLRVHGADIGLDMSVDNDRPAEYQTIQYTITATNNGPDPATNVQILDFLPAELTLLSSSASQGSYSEGSGTWTVGSLGNGASATLTLRVSVDFAATITNTASVKSSDQADSYTSNNSASVRIATNKHFNAGARIINMGVLPQSINNALKPYGLVYTLAIDHKIPVYWSINPDKVINSSKSIDGVDFTVNGVNYSGGPFIIPAEYVSAAASIISTWTAKGVVVTAAQPAFDAPIFNKITGWPNAVLDEQNGSIADNFYIYAEIPSSRFKIGTPADLTACDDIYIMPHADPQDWTNTDKVTLFNFLKAGGYFWYGCHAVSAMEALTDFTGDGISDFMLLSNNGLVEWGDHDDGTPPYTYNTLEAGHPIMQYLGAMDGALQNGSEQIFLPLAGGWRSSTKLMLWDPDHPQVPSLSPGPAALMGIGPAWGDPTLGLIMFQAAHNIDNGTTAEGIAAMRAFLDFNLLSAVDQLPAVHLEAPLEVEIDDTPTLSVHAIGGSAPYTAQWSSACGGTFSSPTSLTTLFTPPQVVGTVECMISVTITDACSRKNTSTTVITITGNQPPVAVDDINNTLMDTPVSGQVLTNDFDPAGDLLAVTTTPVTAPGHGTVVLQANGTYTYTPASGYIGDDYFEYQVCDNGSPALCDVARVDIRVTRRTTANDPPVANADARETLVNKPVTGSLLANDFDPDGNNLLINTTPVSAPSHGTVVINANGTFLYTPAADYVGTDLFTYRVCDDGSPSLCATALVTIQVYPDKNGPINDPPIAADDAYGIRAELLLTGSLALNDSDPNGDPLTYTTAPVSGPSHGTLTINSDGTFSYTSVANYAGPDQFVYQVCDDHGNCDVATAYITVYPGNRAPLAVNDINNTAINSPVSGNVQTNDSDPDGDALTVATTPLIAPVHGSLVLGSDGAYTYTPVTNFVGVDSFKYQICDNGDPVKCDDAICYIYVIEDDYGNNPPVANNDAMETNVNVNIYGNVTSNDDDPDGDALTVNTTPVKAPLHGTVTLNANGTFIYHPATGYVGKDRFVYELCDTGSPVLCTTATVSITIYPIQQPLPNDPPFAADDAFITWVNTAVSGSVSLNDNDPNGNSLIYETTPVSEPSHGTVTINGSGVFTYTPAANYTGPDQFVYMVCDDGEPGLCDEATVYLTVIVPPAPNNAPVAIDDINNTLINTPVSGQVLTNDSDPDGHTITVTTTPVVPPMHGSVVLNSDGTYTYTPTTGYLGLDSFDYQVCDDGLPPLCSTATVWIQVVQDGAGNTAPVANNDAVQTLVDVPINGNVLNNDDDPDGDPLTVSTTPATPPSHGSVTLNADGTFIYTPATGYVGEDLFVYQVCDNGTPALCSTARVIVTVLADPNGPNNDPPFAADDACITLMNTAVSGSVAPNDNDPNGNPLTFNTTPVSGPSHGTVILQADGSFVYTPTAGYTGPDRFIYQVCDNAATPLCDQATAYITVLPITRVRLQLKVFLQGPFETSTRLMKDNLRSLGLLPTTEPYTGMTGFTQVGPGGGETVNPSVFAATGANAIVEWIFVELRNPAAIATVVATRSALLQRDGDVVDLDGLTPLTFEEVGAASYFVAVRHRNHFGTVTAAPVALTNVPTLVDFTTPATATYGTHAQKEVIAGSVLALWMGNVNYPDRKIIYQGPGNDTNSILTAVFADPGNTGYNRNFIVRAYTLADVDLNGQAIYQGPGNDVNMIFTNVLLHPGNIYYLRNYIMNEQLP